jgi:hypothetical protein
MHKRNGTLMFLEITQSMDRSYGLHNKPQTGQRVLDQLVKVRQWHPTGREFEPRVGQISVCG